MAAVGIATTTTAILFYSAVSHEEGSPAGHSAATSAVGAEDAIYLPSVTQTGRLTAITDASLTARGTDGVSQTYLVTPTTTAVTGDGGNLPLSEQFALNETVTIVATVVNGNMTATAVADQDRADPGGPPMDYAIPG